MIVDCWDVCEKISGVIVNWFIKLKFDKEGSYFYIVIYNGFF